MPVGILIPLFVLAASALIAAWRLINEKDSWQKRLAHLVGVASYLFALYAIVMVFQDLVRHHY